MNGALIKTSCKSALQILSISGIRNMLIVPTGKDVYIEQDKSKKDVVLRYQSRDKTFPAYSGASGHSFWSDRHVGQVLLLLGRDRDPLAEARNGEEMDYKVLLVSACLGEDSRKRGFKISAEFDRYHDLMITALSEKFIHFQRFGSVIDLSPLTDVTPGEACAAVSTRDLPHYSLKVEPEYQELVDDMTSVISKYLPHVEGGYGEPDESHLAAT